MFEIIFGAVLALFAAGGIWAFIVSRKVKKEGIETEAVVSRIELHEWTAGTMEGSPSASVTEEYYVTYTNQEGQRIEAMLSNPDVKDLAAGTKIKIRYLPDRQDYPVFVGKM